MTHRVRRGGTWLRRGGTWYRTLLSNGRSAYRSVLPSSEPPDDFTGFRVVCLPLEVKPTQVAIRGGSHARLNYPLSVPACWFPDPRRPVSGAARPGAARPVAAFAIRPTMPTTTSASA
jgi:hypothetical protein